MSKCENIPFFNKMVLNIIKEYPTDGTFDYYWEPVNADDGVTEELVYLGTTISKPNSRKTCFCCGISFEIFFKAYSIVIHKCHLIRKKLSINDMKILKFLWYCSTLDHHGKYSGCLGALTQMKLGMHIENLHDAKPGDFIQYWRHNGSGHSAIFLEWKFDPNSKDISGITYWSSQRSTRGIGVKSETIDDNNIDKNQIYIVRFIL
jgi:hypothetical protein